VCLSFFFFFFFFLFFFFFFWLDDIGGSVLIRSFFPSFSSLPFASPAQHVYRARNPFR